MLTLIKQLQLYAKSVIILFSNKCFTSEKHQDYSQEQENHPISQSRSSPVKNVDTSTSSFNLNKERNWNRHYSGLQREIYLEGDAKASSLEQMD